MSDPPKSGIDGWLSSALDDIVKQQKIGRRGAASTAKGGRPVEKLGGVKKPKNAKGGPSAKAKAAANKNDGQSDPRTLQQRLDAALEDTEKAMKAEARQKAQTRRSSAPAAKAAAAKTRSTRKNSASAGQNVKSRKQHPGAYLGPRSDNFPSGPSTALQRQRFARRPHPFSSQISFQDRQLRGQGYYDDEYVSGVARSERNIKLRAVPQRTVQGLRVVAPQYITRVPDHPSNLYEDGIDDEEGLIQYSTGGSQTDDTVALRSSAHTYRHIGPTYHHVPKKIVNEPVPTSRTVSLGRVRYPPDEPFNLSPQERSVLRKLKVVADLGRIPPGPDVLKLGPKPRRPSERGSEDYDNGYHHSPHHSIQGGAPSARESVKVEVQRSDEYSYTTAAASGDSRDHRRDLSPKNLHAPRSSANAGGGSGYVRYKRSPGWEENRHHPRGPPQSYDPRKRQ